MALHAPRKVCAEPWMWCCHLQLGRQPVVIEAGGLQRDPEKTLRALCTALDLEFNEKMLT